MNEHRAECEHEGVTCVIPGCDARLLRKDLIQHLWERHKQEAGQLLVSTLRQNALLEDKAAGKIAELESEKRLAASSTTSWVFNWRAEGWGAANSRPIRTNSGMGSLGSASSWPAQIPSTRTSSRTGFMGGTSAGCT